MIEGLKKAELSVEDSEEASRKIVYVLDRLEGYTELLLFLKSLSDKYPSYRPAFVQFKQEEAATKDKARLETLQAKLRQFAAAPN